MKKVLVLLLFFIAASAQASSILIFKIESVSEGYKLFLDGKEYITKDAAVLKFKAAPSNAFITFMVKGRMAQPIAQNISIDDDTEVIYSLIDTSKTGNPSIRLDSTKQINETYRPYDLGDDFATFRYGISNPEERFMGKQAQSAKAKRSKEETNIPATSTIDLDGKKQTATGTEKKTTSSKETKSIAHSERSGTVRGGAQYPSMFPPKELKECAEAWSEEERDSTMNEVNANIAEAKKLFYAKSAASDFCITTEDAKGILLQMGNESARVEFAKFVYASLVDRDNFDLLKDLFDSEASFVGVKDYVAIKYD